MLETSSRLLRLLSLLQARRFWTGAELAAHLEVTERTVRRDVDRLRSLGYPVNATSGVAGGYQLAAGASVPPLLLEDDEALAVALGLRTAASGTVAGVEQAAVKALSKLEQILPRRLRERVAALHGAVVPLHRAAPTIDPDVLTTIAAACRDSTRVRFTYGDREARETERAVDPHGLVHTGTRWYLVAWDPSRDGFRTFRVDRISGRVTAGARFSPREVPGGDLAAYVSRSVASSPYTHRVRVQLHAPAEEIARRIPPTAGTVEAIDTGRCRLETGGNSLESIALWIAYLDVPFEVEEPDALREAMRGLGERLIAATAQRKSR